MKPDSENDKISYDGGTLLDRIHAWYERQNTEHPETSFVLRASILVFLVMAGGSILDSNIFAAGIFFLAIIFMPMYYAIFCMHRWRTGSSGFFRNLWEFTRENVTIISVPVVEHREKLRDVSAWVTYSLILVNEIVYYFIQVPFPKIQDHLIFIPPAHEWWSLPFALFASMFMHADDWHLWGNMLFLWAVGTVVERRIGWRLFLGGYLISGIIASLLAVDIHYYLLESEIHALGASGAISGAMGMYMIRCYFKRMVFPVPFFGIFPFINFKVRINSMAFIGLFFAMDVQAGYGQIAGDVFSRVAHWAHIGGMYAGMLIAASRKLERDADLEFSEEKGMSAIQDGTLSSAAFDQLIGLDAAEQNLRKVLAAHPGDTEVMLQLARTRSHLVQDPEAKELYGQVLGKLVASDPKKAVAVFREYYRKYMDIAPPETQYRLTPYLLKEGDYQRASRGVELVIDHPDATDELKGKAMYILARIFDEMDLPEPAREMRLRYLANYPASVAAEKVRAALAASENS